MKITSLLIISLFVSPASAKVYKCLVNEQTKYQAVPCPASTSNTEEIELKDNTVSTQGLRQAIKQDKVPKKRREKRKKEAKKAKRAWMNQQTNAYTKQRKQLNKKKAAERKKKNKKKDRRERLSVTKRSKPL
ncbi:MAG: hypothetical protein KAJ63_15170 [Methyloprofundus sp.]|nr:hypothetical protein [Methyloprofundus sp.]